VLLDTMQGPSELSQCDDLLFLSLAQDIANADGDSHVTSVHPSVAAMPAKVLGRPAASAV